MHADICILAPADSFARLLLSECKEQGKTVLHIDSDKPLPTADLYIIDADASLALPAEGRILRYGRHLFDTVYEENGRTVAELHRPFSLLHLRRALGTEASAPFLSLLPDGRSVRRGDSVISLTPTEYACLSCLLAANGAPVSRKALYAAAWGEGAYNDALVNLYLHYLRKKLETDGRRLIFSARGRGYYIKEEGATV